MRAGGGSSPASAPRAPGGWGPLSPSAAGPWRSCCASGRTPAWCWRRARRPCTWQPERTARAPCGASGSCCAGARTPMLGKARRGDGDVVPALRRARREDDRGSGHPSSAQHREGAEAQGAEFAASLGHPRLLGKGNIPAPSRRPRSAEALTPVHVAAAWGCRGALELLLSGGGDPTLRDQVRTLRGRTGRREGTPRAPPADRVCTGRAPTPGLGASAATPQLCTRAAGAGRAPWSPGTRR